MRVNVLKTKHGYYWPTRKNTYEINGRIRIAFHLEFTLSTQGKKKKQAHFSSAILRVQYKPNTN